MSCTFLEPVGTKTDLIVGMCVMFTDKRFSEKKKTKIIINNKSGLSDFVKAMVYSQQCCMDSFPGFIHF